MIRPIRSSVNTRRGCFKLLAAAHHTAMQGGCQNKRLAEAQPSWTYRGCPAEPFPAKLHITRVCNFMRRYQVQIPKPPGLAARCVLSSMPSIAQNPTIGAATKQCHLWQRPKQQHDDLWARWDKFTRARPSPEGRWPHWLTHIDLFTTRPLRLYDFTRHPRTTSPS